MSRNSFAIIGGTLWGNRGAEAMVVTTMAELRRRVPDASFVVQSYYPAADRRLAAGTGIVIDDARPIRLLLLYTPFAMLVWLARLVRLRWPDALLPRPLRRLRAARALFDVSGITFHDGRLAIVAYNVFCIWPALLCGVPVVHLSQARGPFENPVNRLAAKLWLRACRHSYARGRITAELMDGLGLPADKWSTAADVAFAFTPGDSVTREGEAETATLADKLAAIRAEGRAVVALSPSSVVLGKTASAGLDYVGVLARAVRHLVELGHHVVVLPNATRAGAEGARNNDLVVIARLREALAGTPALDPGATSWVEWDLNTDGIRTVIGAAELLVTSRFHAMVAGLALAVPTFVIGWSHKYEEVLEMFGCPEDAIDFSSLDEGLIPAIDAMLAKRADRKRQLEAAWPSVLASSRGQFDIVGDLVR